MKKLIAFLLALVMLVGIFAACEQAPAETTAPGGLTAEEQAILQQRRDTAEAYMRSMATVLWRAGESVDYFKGQGDLHIVEGRLYRGIPYAYAAGNDAVFLGFSQGEENGIHQIQGLTMDLMGRNDDYIRRVGNDCSGSVLVSWAQVATSFQSKNTQYMVPENGFLRVGEYKSSDSDNTDSKAMCEENGVLTMFAAYAQLQKADAVVHRTATYGHVMMVTSVHVEYNAKGNIDANKSYITTLHQTNGYLQKEAKAYDEALGEDVYQTFGIDDKVYFYELYSEGYLPITCKEFIDPSLTYPEAEVKDSLENPTIDDLYTGEFTSNLFISLLDITVKNGAGEIVQQARGFTDRKTFNTLPLAEFIDNPTRTVGKVDVSLLEAGEYTVTYELELVNGQRFVVRELTFTAQ